MNRFFAVFFAFGATMCTVTVLLILFPGTCLDSLWQLNPDAHTAFQYLGKISILLMSVVGAGCVLAAIGMWDGSLWGMRLAIAILSVNILGDLFNALLRQDLRTLIGLPISGTMIVLLIRRWKRPAIPD